MTMLISTFTFCTPSSAQIDATFSFINPSCPGASDGQLCCETLTGGIAPYSCSLLENVGTYNPMTNCFEDMPSGIFHITITDSQNNSGSAIGYVGQSSVLPIVANVTIQPAGCGVSDGTACCTVTGGSGSYTYQWIRFSDFQIIGTGLCVTGLSASDSYLFTVYDANTPCFEIYQIVVTEISLSAKGEEQTNTIVQLWPNPFHNLLKAVLPKDANRVFITDMTGRMVFEEKVYFPNQQWELSKLERGAYLLNVECEDGRVMGQRIVKQ